MATFLAGQIDQEGGDHRQQNCSFGQHGGGVEREIEQITRGGRGLGGEKESTHVGHGSLEPLRFGDSSGA